MFSLLFVSVLSLALSLAASVHSHLAMRVLLCLSLCVSEWAAMADGARCEPKPHVQRLPPITEGFWRSANSELELRWSRHPTAPRVTFELTLHSDRYSWFGLGVSTEGEMVSQETTALLPGSVSGFLKLSSVPLA